MPRLARTLGSAGPRIVDLVQGRVALPAPVALLAALADALRTTVAAVDAATRAATPRMGPAKAEGAPVGAAASLRRHRPGRPDDAAGGARTSGSPSLED